LQIAKIHLDLVEESPGPLALRQEQAAAVLESACGASRDGAHDVQVRQQRLGRRGLRSDGRWRRVVGDAQDEQRVSHHQLPCRLDSRDVGLIEPTDLACAQPMRHDRLDEPHAVSGIGARQRHAVLHRGVRDQPAVVHVLLHGLGQRAHQTHAARDPAHAAIEAPGQRVERQAVIVMQRAEQPALLERAVGGIRTQELPKDQRLSLRHLPHDGGDGVPVQPAETPDAFVAVDDDVGRPVDHHHDRHLLTGIGQGRQEAAFARRLPQAQPLVPQLELMKFQVHRPSVRRRLLWHRADRVLHGGRGKSAATSNAASHLTGPTGLARLTGEVGPLPLSDQ